MHTRGMAESDVLGACDHAENYKSHECEDIRDIHEDFYSPECFLKPRKRQEPLPQIHSALQASRSQGKRRLSLTKESLELMAIKPRLRTFGDDWPGPDPTAMAQAGFYRRRGNRAACAYCPVEIRNWSAADCPWQRHKVWSPCCRYLRYAHDVHVSSAPKAPLVRRASFSSFFDLTRPQ